MTRKTNSIFAFNCAFCGTLAFQPQVTLLFAYFNSHDYAALFATAMAVLRVLFALDRSLGLFSTQRTPAVFLALSRIIFP